MIIQRLFLFTFLLSFLIPALAQDYTVSVTTVAVWVKATDKEGNPETGLVSGDFSVLEDNRPMPISCFEERNLDASQNGEKLLQKRKLILAIDLYNTSHTEFFAVRDALANFVDQLDPETWDVMVAAILASAPTEAVPFTNEFEQIHNELQSLKGNTFRDQEIAKRKREIVEMLKSGRIAGGKARAYELAQFYAQDEQQIAEQTLRGLVGLGKYLSNAEEHVVIVFVSGGINTRPGLQYRQLLEKADTKRDFDADMSAFRNPSFMEKIQKQLSVLLQKNVTIYGLNTRGTFNPGTDHVRDESSTYSVTDRSMLSYYQEGMDEVAALSGGLSFKNLNDFERPLATILADTTSQYIICYKPEHQDDKEKYRKIEVKTNKSGITLRHRKGYWTTGTER
ncbi:MAG TPA: VWA domain-containing protein [Acidobacteriota bacterium]